MNQAVLSFVCLRASADPQINMPPPCRNAHLPQGQKQPKTYRLSGLATHGSKTNFAKEGGAHTENLRKNMKPGFKKHVTLYSTPLSAGFGFSQNPQVVPVFPQVSSVFPQACFLVCYHFLLLLLLFIEREREKEGVKGIRKSAAKIRKSKNHVTGPIRRLHRHPQVNLRMVEGKKASVFNGLRCCSGSSADPQEEMPPSPPRALFFGGADRGQ